MNFIKIENINNLKIGDIIGISTQSLESKILKKELLLADRAYSLFLSTVVENKQNEKGYLIENRFVSFETAKELGAIIYMITQDDFPAITNDFMQLQRYAKKKAKEAKKYKTMLIKRFEATEEEINRNFDNSPKKKNNNKFVAYQTCKDTVPLFKNGNKVRVPVDIVFSSNSVNRIKCEIFIRDFDTRVEATSVCHKEDVFDLKAGESIAYNKAYAKAISAIH